MDRHGRVPGLRILMILAFLSPGVHGHAAKTYIFSESPARQCFQEADKRTPPYDVRNCDLALEHEGLKREDRAATLSNRGLVYKKLHNLEQALRDQDAAIRLTPELSGAHINRGNVLIALKRYAEALESMNRGIELADENLPLAYYNRALLFRLLGDQKSARDDAERAAELDPLQKRYEALKVNLAEAKQSGQ